MNLIEPPVSPVVLSEPARLNDKESLVKCMSHVLGKVGQMARLEKAQMLPTPRRGKKLQRIKTSHPESKQTKSR